MNDVQLAKLYFALSANVHRVYSKAHGAPQRERETIEGLPE